MVDLITVCFCVSCCEFYRSKLESRTFAAHVLFTSIRSINESGFNPKNDMLFNYFFRKDLMKCICALSRIGNRHRIHGWIWFVKHVRLNVSSLFAIHRHSMAILSELLKEKKNQILFFFCFCIKYGRRHLHRLRFVWVDFFFFGWNELDDAETGKETGIEKARW